MKRIVILGAGFGGLRAANVLSRRLKKLNLNLAYQVILIDRNAYHTFTPLLYEIATTSKNTATASRLERVTTHHIESLIDRAAVEFIQDEVTRVDVASGEIGLKTNEVIEADYLLLAPGSATNFFSIRGLKEHAFTLKSFIDAIKIRDALWNRAMDKNKVVRAVVGGGGSSGVELAGELRALCGEFATEFAGCRIDVRIIEAQSAILHGFAEDVVAHARARLDQLGVELLENERIASVVNDHINLESGRSIPYDVFVWTGGIAPPELLQRIAIKRDKIGRAEVNECLECTTQTSEAPAIKKIYAVGDAALIVDGPGNYAAPQVAPAAIDQGETAAYNILEEIKLENGITREAHRRRYLPHEYPYIIPIGGKYAVAHIKPFVITGFFGWIIKGIIELRYLFSIMPTMRAIRIWLHGLRIFVQNDRLG